jgi:hypothetical protein
VQTLVNQFKVDTLHTQGTNLIITSGWDKSRQLSERQLNIGDLQRLEEAVGYQFKDKSLLVEAMTHPSAKTEYPCYQVHLYLVS